MIYLILIYFYVWEYLNVKIISSTLFTDEFLFKTDELLNFSTFFFQKNNSTYLQVNLRSLSYKSHLGLLLVIRVTQRMEMISSLGIKSLGVWLFYLWMVWSSICLFVIKKFFIFPILDTYWKVVLKCYIVIKFVYSILNSLFV